MTTFPSPEGCASPGESWWCRSAVRRAGRPARQQDGDRVELLFDVEHSSAFLPVQRERVIDKLAPVVRIVVDDERSQLRNRALAEQRLVARLASGPPR